LQHWSWAAVQNFQTTCTAREGFYKKLPVSRSPADTTHTEWKRMERCLGAGITMWSAPGNIKCSTPVSDLPHCRHLKHSFALDCRYSYNWAPVPGAYVSMETHMEQA
jgi:hypothetical protein